MQILNFKSTSGFSTKIRLAPSPNFVLCDISLIPLHLPASCRSDTEDFLMLSWRGVLRVTRLSRVSRGLFCSHSQLVALILRLQRELVLLEMGGCHGNLVLLELVQYRSSHYMHWMNIHDIISCNQEQDSTEVSKGIVDIWILCNMKERHSKTS